MGGFSAVVPDLEYWKENVPCQNACPVHTDARGYVRAIADGDFEQAYLIARGPNPLASVCGRVCAAPCEASCRRGKIDDPISIRGLKRYVTTQYGSEANPEGGLFDYLKEKLQERQCEGVEELRNYIDGYDGAGAKVAIIGSGPAGLACAHDLALMGFKPTIFELESVAAGMLYVGIPEYRLPRDLIRAEVGVVESLGVEIKCDTCVGKDITLDQLLTDHQAVVLAVGAKKSRALPIPGAEGPGVLAGIDFLRDVALGRSVTIGKKIIVIGGGNVSYDVARSAWRKKGEEIEPNPARFVGEDVSRVAIHEGDHAEVHLCCLESREQMLADDIEVEEAEEEGVIRHNSVGPQEILRDADGKITGLRFSKVISLFDEEGRFSPTFDHDQSEIIECDTVLVSIGQMCDLSFLGDHHGVELNERKYPAHDPETFMTTADGIFVAGDLQTGPRLIIDAVASGKKCARGIYKHLTGKAVDVDSQQRHFELEDYSREIGYEAIGRSEIATLHPEERRSFSKIVELGFQEDEATLEASRCLDCGVNTIFDGERCILCGGCADVCPELCLRLTSIDKLDLSGDELKAVLADCAEGVDLAECSVIIKDEDRCIRCASCADRCPVGAVSMERFCYRDEVKPECALAIGEK